MRVRIQATLPYFLYLPDGEYPFPAQQSLFLNRRVESRTDRAQTFVVFHSDVHFFIEREEGLPREEAQKVDDREARDLLRRVNRLLRWYRFLTSRSDLYEVTLELLSPVVLADADSGALLAWLDYGGGDKIPWMAKGEADRLASEIRQHLTEGGDPDAARLTVLDAEVACRFGRFCEAVLLSWSVIDSSVVRRFDALVEDNLIDEWREGKDYLKGVEFGLRHKMTTGLKLLCGRSIFQDPKLWQTLSESYAKRNEIIHRNQAASSEDATKAIDVARDALAFLDNLPT